MSKDGIGEPVHLCSLARGLVASQCDVHQNHVLARMFIEYLWPFSSIDTINYSLCHYKLSNYSLCLGKDSKILGHFDQIPAKKGAIFHFKGANENLLETCTQLGYHARLSLGNALTFIIA